MTYSKTSRRRTRRGVAGVAALCLALVVSPAVAPPAAAETSNWWYDLYDVGTVHAEGWTGAGVKVAVIDAQINPDLPVFEGRSLTVAEGTLCADAGAPTTTVANGDSVHATTLAALLIGNGTGAGAVQGIAPDAALTFYGQGDRAANTDTCEDAAEHPSDLSWYALGVQRALDDGNRIIVNATGVTPEPHDDEVIANAIAKGAILVEASPNPNEDQSSSYGWPWGFNGTVVASALDSNGDLQKVEETGEYLAFAETTVAAAGADMPTVGSDESGSWDDSFSASGSSLAAPLVAGMLAVVAQRYPEATGNQLVQHLIHNTGREDRPFEEDPTGGYGYGTAWLTHMLREDPTQFPDVNPLMEKTSGEPTLQQVEEAAARGSALPDFDGADEVDATGEATPEAGAPGVASPVTSPLTTVTTVVLVGAGVLVAGAIVLTLVLITVRRRKTHQGGTP